MAESSSKTSLPQWFQWTLNTADRAVSRSKLQVTRVTVVTSISLEHAARWSTGSSVWTWGRTSSLWGWRSPGTGRPGRLWILLLWRYSKPAWTRSCAACCRWPCFIRGVVLDDPQRSLPTPTILWFCGSVIVHMKHMHLRNFCLYHKTHTPSLGLSSLVHYLEIISYCNY